MPITVIKDTASSVEYVLLMANFKKIIIELCLSNSLQSPNRCFSRSNRIKLLAICKGFFLLEINKIANCFSDHFKVWNEERAH